MSDNQEKLNEQLFNVIADEKVSDEAKLKKLKYLVRLGADVNAKDNWGETVLIDAVNWGHIEVVKCLVELGADLEAKDEWYGETALMKAARGGNLDMVKCLVEHGAQLDVKCENYEIAKEVARIWKRYDCLKFLEEAQKKVSAQKTKGDKTGASQIVKADEGR